jgi:hypothetical protein
LYLVRFEDNLLRYEKEIKLAGIMYLQRITDNQRYRDLRIFTELCGNQAMKKVVLVTTMWDKVSSKKQDIIAAREKELFDNYWNTMIKQGASTARFENTPASAWKIVDVILKQPEAEVLLLQEELVDLKRALNETTAGKTLYTHLQRLLAEQRDAVRFLAQQAREENKPELARQLETELKRIRKDFDKTFKEMNNLKIPFGKRLMLSFGKKSRGVSYSSILRLFYFCTHCLVRTAFLAFLRNAQCYPQAYYILVLMFP